MVEVTIVSLVRSSMTLIWKLSPCMKCQNCNSHVAHFVRTLLPTMSGPGICPFITTAERLYPSVLTSALEIVKSATGPIDAAAGLAKASASATHAASE